jgi:hypothetical protein
MISVGKRRRLNRDMGADLRLAAPDYSATVNATVLFGLLSVQDLA